MLVARSKFGSTPGALSSILPPWHATHRHLHADLTT